MTFAQGLHRFLGTTGRLTRISNSMELVAGGAAGDPSSQSSVSGFSQASISLPVTLVYCSLPWLLPGLLGGYRRDLGLWMGPCTEPEGHLSPAWGVRNCRVGGKGSSYTEYLGAGAARSHCSVLMAPMTEKDTGSTSHIGKGWWQEPGLGHRRGPAKEESEHCTLPRRPGPGMAALLFVWSRRQGLLTSPLHPWEQELPGPCPGPPLRLH